MHDVPPLLVGLPLNEQPLVTSKTSAKPPIQKNSGLVRRKWWDHQSNPSGARLYITMGHVHATTRSQNHARAVVPNS